MLQNHPDRPGPQFSRLPVRPWLAHHYQPLPDQIVIIRVLHGARDIAAIAEHGGFTE
jgi:plasmid stabilization system protein ParE